MPQSASDIYIYTHGHYIEEDGLKGAGYSYTILTGNARFEQAGPSVIGHLVAEYEAVGQALESCKDLLEKKLAHWTEGDAESLMVHVCASHPDVGSVGANRMTPPDMHAEKFVHMLNNFRCGLSLCPEEFPLIQLAFDSFRENPVERHAVAERARGAARLATVQNVRCDRLTTALDSLESTGIIPAAAVCYFRGPFLKDSILNVLKVRQDPAAQQVSSKVRVDLPKPAPDLYRPAFGRSRFLIPRRSLAGLPA